MSKKKKKKKSNYVGFQIKLLKQALVWLLGVAKLSVLNENRLVTKNAVTLPALKSDDLRRRQPHVFAGTLRRPGTVRVSRSEVLQNSSLVEILSEERLRAFQAAKRSVVGGKSEVALQVGRFEVAVARFQMFRRGLRVHEDVLLHRARAHLAHKARLRPVGLLQVTTESLERCFRGRRWAGDRLVAEGTDRGTARGGWSVVHFEAGGGWSVVHFEAGGGLKCLKKVLRHVFQVTSASEKIIKLSNKTNYSRNAIEQLGLIKLSYNKRWHQN